MAGEDCTDYPFERAKMRHDKAPHQLYLRFYGASEDEAPENHALFEEAVLGSSTQITREACLRD